MRLMDRLLEGHNRHHPVESIEELFQLRNQASFLLVTEGSLLLFFVVLLFFIGPGYVRKSLLAKGLCNT